MKIDKNLSSNRANGLYFKIKKCASLKILKSICFIFDSYLSYCSLVWPQNSSTIQQVAILQKKAVIIIKVCGCYFLFYHQMIAIQKLRKMLFISSKKLFSCSRYSNFSISIHPSFSPCQPFL